MSDQTTSAKTSAGPDPSTTAKPSAMQGREFLYGHLVAGALIAVAIANFVIRHGTGAPKHPQTTLSIIGLVAAVALLPVLRTRNRFIAPFAAVIAAFFVTFPRGPSRLQSLHVIAIIVPLVWALLLTQRQRKAAMAQAKARGAARSAERSTERPRRRKSRRGKDTEEEVRSRVPERNRRYTPPKAKRAKR